MSEVISTEPTPSHPVSTPAPETSVEVFAVYGVEPEIQAYAMAKYSRSSLSMKESLKEITLQKAEKFLNTFYFQYGHRSIADLAHIALAIERLSILAAIVVADEQRWDGQERSTRYQDFRKSGYYKPDFGDDASARELYQQTLDPLFADYEQRWDGQERSTRYQDFRKSGYYKPDFGDDASARELYQQTLDQLFADYEQ